MFAHEKTKISKTTLELSYTNGQRDADARNE